MAGHTESYKIAGTRGRLYSRSNQYGGHWIDGCVITLDGIVEVYADEHGEIYELVWGGRLWRLADRSARPKTKKGLATRAARFAHDVANGVAA